jgi:hypothetical protein
MYSVCFHTEKQWEQNQWSFLFSNFGVTDIWEMGGKLSTIYQSTNKIDKTSELPDKPLVILAPQDGRFIKGVESLVDFKHPDDCVYLFGGSNQVLTYDVVDRKPDFLVYVPLVKHEAFSHAVAYMTLYDRRVKRGESSN